MLRLTGGGWGVYIESADGAEYFGNLHDSITVGQLKERIKKLKDIDPSEQILMHDGRILDDSEVVWKLGACSLWLEVRPSVTLTVGAGGTIKQEIAEDHHNPRIWDIANAKLLSIQIVNSASFEQITGMLAPPTPIDARTYAKQKLPFYELYNETPSTVGGAFAHIQPVPDRSTVKPCTTCKRKSDCM